MTDYVSVRSNWSSTNSISLEQICDVILEEENQSTEADNQDTDDHLRKTTSADDSLTNVILRCNPNDTREDPVIIISVLQPDERQIVSIQLLSNARHIEFYHREYLGSCQGSRVTELDSECIYESAFELHQVHEHLTLKCLKLGDADELSIYCIQITMKKIQSVPSTSFPFDINRVRSMVDENHLSSNARQFMNDLQHIQEQRRTKEVSSPQFNLSSLMSLMTGMKSSSTASKQATSAPLSSIVNEIRSSLNEDVKNTYSQDNEQAKQELNALESRLESYIAQRFDELKRHIDQRFNHLEDLLTKSK
ncbi:unnamed protein product [Adineta ricciae]|uniref:Uncharacterized protein n=1 Tax=Adineta ricciae TaxID=249248 RepID=A0A813NY78_ADIRI|nr:unnamed protein product [Adineta ricciae]CAF1052601.1 unnamed protein product [Adineta ricciae]